MIRINNKEFPSKWEELSPEQWLGIVDAMLEFGAGKCGFDAFQFRLVEAIVGKLPQDPGNSILCENIFRMSEIFSWPYIYSYKDSRYDKLSEQIKEQLQHRLPSQLDQGDPEVRIALSFEAQVRFDLCFAAQLLPVLPSDSSFRGYAFSLDGSLVHTDLTAVQYVTATGLMEMICVAEAEYPDEVLSSLLSVLYHLQDGKGTVRPTGHISYSEKMAVMLNFQAVIEWISRIPKYDLLFRRAHGAKYSSPLGMEGSLYTLSEKGYGDIDKVGGMNLFTYLDVLLKQTIDSIHMLNSCKMKPGDIASELNLSVEQVLNIITKS